MANILVIDDDFVVRRILQNWLSELGHEVRLATNGREGVEAYESEPAELVLTDVFMPDEDGLETIRSLRRDHPDVRIVAMSAGGQRLKAKTFLDQAKCLGALGTLQKPFEVTDLEAIIELAFSDDV